MHRRAFFVSLSSVLGTSAFDAEAARRPPYGHQLHADVPLSLARLDPHEPHNLATELLGRAVFDPLFALTSGGVPYPTLAAQLPQRSRHGLTFSLRDNLSFASGRPLTPSDVLHSLKRVSHMTPGYVHLSQIQEHPTKKNALFLPTPLSPENLARQLSRSRTSIVPANFSPTRPDGTGAFLATLKAKSLELAHNPRAPRGGAFLDRAFFRSTSVRQSLRAFEATTSSLCLLGKGLYQPRRDARPLGLAPLGYVLLLPNSELRSRIQPGELQAALNHISSSSFQSLGIVRSSQRARSWNIKEITVGYDATDPWLTDIATEVQKALTRGGTSTQLVPTGPYLAKTHRRREDLTLAWLTFGDAPQEEITFALFDMDGKRPPRVGRTPSPEEATRQLHLGLLGRIVPSAFSTPAYVALTGRGRLTLEQSFARPERS